MPFEHRATLNDSILSAQLSAVPWDHRLRAGQPVRFPKGQEMNVFGIAAAVVVAAPGVGRAAPCAGAGADPVACQHCMFYVTAYHTANVCNEDRPRPAQVAPSSVPTWQMPPMPVVQEPPPVQAPPAIAPSP